MSEGQIAWTSTWTVDVHPTDRDRFVAAVGTSFDHKSVWTTNAEVEWTLPSSEAGNHFRVVHHPLTQTWCSRETSALWTGARPGADPL